MISSITVYKLFHNFTWTKSEPFWYHQQFSKANQIIPIISAQSPPPTPFWCLPTIDRGSYFRELLFSPPLRSPSILNNVFWSSHVNNPFKISFSFSGMRPVSLVHVTKHFRRHHGTILGTFAVTIAGNNYIFLTGFLGILYSKEYPFV